MDAMLWLGSGNLPPDSPDFFTQGQLLGPEALLLRSEPKAEERRFAPGLGPLLKNTRSDLMSVSGFPLKEPRLNERPGSGLQPQRFQPH